jgi:hypothetical protein
MQHDLELLAIPTNQQARHDLVAVGDEIEEEKDRLLNCVRGWKVEASWIQVRFGGRKCDTISTRSNQNRDLTRILMFTFSIRFMFSQFMEFGDEVCQKIRQAGYWADYIDPCSGLPMLTKCCNKVYSEVDGMECLLNYKAYNAGFCKVLTHPRWGSAVYPATMFCYAPRDVVTNILHSQYI